MFSITAEECAENALRNSTLFLFTVGKKSTFLTKKNISFKMSQVFSRDTNLSCRSYCIFSMVSRQFEDLKQESVEKHPSESRISSKRGGEGGGDIKRKQQTRVFH